jgi:(2Fe-2S) ferredoxin
MAFRFTIRDGKSTILTPWYKEITPQDAPAIANEIRMTYPDAEFEIERQNVRPTTQDAKLKTE